MNDGLILQGLSISGSAITNLPGCFCPWAFVYKIALNLLLWQSFESNLYSQLEKYTGELYALSLIVPLVFGGVD